MAVRRVIIILHSYDGGSLSIGCCQSLKIGIIIVYLFIYYAEGSTYCTRHNYKDRKNTRNTKIHKKMETIKKITERMKSWSGLTRKLDGCGPSDRGHRHKVNVSL